MKHVIEMIQHARRLAEGTDNPEFLRELDAALHRLNTYDEIERDRINNLTSSERFRRLSNELVASNCALQDALANTKDRHGKLEETIKYLREENATLKAENEKLARMVDQRGDAESASIRPMPVGAAAVRTPDDTIEIVQPAKYVGQEWCRIGSPDPRYLCLGIYGDTYLVLCEVHRDVETGELTRTPIPINELPWV